jgi:hypothetical protein
MVALHFFGRSFDRSATVRLYEYNGAVQDAVSCLQRRTRPSHRVHRLLCSVDLCILDTPLARSFTMGAAGSTILEDIEKSSNCARLAQRLAERRQ